MKGILDRIEKLLKQKGMTAKDLSIICGISTNRLSLWKARDTMPPADVALNIARALGVSVEYLVTGKEPAAPHSIDKERIIKAAQDAVADAINAL